MLTEAAVSLAMAPYKYLIGIYDPPPLNGKNIIVTGAQQRVCIGPGTSWLCLLYQTFASG